MLVLVAARTSPLGTPERQRTMAFLARHDCMLADQWKPRDVVIERRNLVPANLSVTLLAAAAELSVVSVILLVTPYAGRCQLLAIEVAGMADVALDLCVGESKRKFRLIMIEVDADPLVLIVAGLAFPAISTGVDVLNSVAFDTR